MVPTQTADKKRKHILNAVRDVLTNKGYAGTTITQVAETAGVSRGLLHYYFKNKEEMLVAVARDSLHEGLTVICQAVDAASDAGHLAGMLSEGFRAFLAEIPGFFNVFLELWTLTHTSETVAEEYTRQYRDFREGLGRHLRSAMDRGALPAHMDPEVLAGIVVGILDGVGLQLATDEELMRTQAFWAGLRACLTATLKADPDA